MVRRADLGVSGSEKGARAARMGCRPEAWRK